MNGLMIRSRPPPVFYMGAFFAESLILAETGNSVGAIQIAGTAQPAQLPFFVAACDYTLIARSCSPRAPTSPASHKQLLSEGQDVGKRSRSRRSASVSLLTTFASLPGSRWLWQGQHGFIDLFSAISA